MCRHVRMRFLNGSEMYPLDPSGYVKIAIENGPLIVDLPTKNKNGNLA